MESKNIQSKINDQVGIALLPLGYKLTNKMEGVFNKKFDWGLYSISVGFVNYLPSRILVGASVGIRINVVENILQFFVKKSKESFKGSLTRGDSLIGLVRGDKDIHIEANSYDGLERAVNETIEMVFSHGFDYLEKYSSIAENEKYANGITSELLLSRPNNAYRGLILAKLVGRQDFEELVSMYQDRAERYSPVMYKDIFFQMVDYLRSSDLKEFMGVPLPPKKTVGIASGESN